MCNRRRKSSSYGRAWPSAQCVCCLQEATHFVFCFLVCSQVYSGVDSKLQLRLGESLTSDLAHDAPKYRPIPGRLHHPWGVAVSTDCETIAVTDAFHHCVQLFDSHDGKCLGLIGNGKGHAVGYLQKPAGICFDSKGNVFVADSGNHRIQKFSVKVVAVRTYGHGEGIDFGYLKYPLGVDISADDSLLFVADRCVRVCVCVCVCVVPLQEVMMREFIVMIVYVCV